MAVVALAVMALLLALYAALLCVRATTHRERHRAIGATDAQTPGELAAGATAAQGPPSGPVAVEGWVEAGAEGLLRAPMSATQCVWYRSRVTRVYTEGDAGGGRSLARDVVADECTAVPFLVRGGQGAVQVRLTGVVEDAALSVSDFELHDRGTRREPVELCRGDFSITHTPSSGATRSYEFEEWVLEPSQTVFVLGHVSEDGELLELTDSPSHPLVVSASSREVVAADARRGFWKDIARAALAGAAAAALVVAVIAMRA